MKTKFITNAVTILMASATLLSCSLGFGKGDLRDRNLENALLTQCDTIIDIQYVGMSDIHELGGNRIQAVVIYYVLDSVGNRIEHNARVTTNDDCSMIYTWEDIDSKVLEDVKQKVCDKFEEKGIDIDGNLIDALIELKRR